MKLPRSIHESSHLHESPKNLSGVVEDNCGKVIANAQQHDERIVCRIDARRNRFENAISLSVALILKHVKIFSVITNHAFRS